MKLKKRHLCLMTLETSIEYMFRVAGKTLLWDGKTRRRTFFSEREFFLFRDRTVVWPSVARLDSPDRGKGKILSRKRKSLRVFPSKCNSFQPYGYIFSSPGPLTNHKKITTHIPAATGTHTLYFRLPLDRASFMDAPWIGHLDIYLFYLY